MCSGQAGAQPRSPRCSGSSRSPLAPSGAEAARSHCARFPPASPPSAAASPGPGGTVGLSRAALAAPRFQFRSSAGRRTPAPAPAPAALPQRRSPCPAPPARPCAGPQARWRGPQGSAGSGGRRLRSPAGSSGPGEKRSAPGAATRLRRPESSRTLAPRVRHQGPPQPPRSRPPPALRRTHRDPQPLRSRSAPAAAASASAREGPEQRLAARAARGTPQPLQRPLPARRGSAAGPGRADRAAGAVVSLSALPDTH